MHRRLRGSFRALLMLGLVVLVATACSRVSFLYRNLDWVIPWRVDDYLALNREQSRFMEARLDGLLSWHCSERLPAYVERLDQVQRTPVTYDNLHERYQWGRAEVDRLWAQAMPSLAPLMANLSDRQVQGLARALEEKQQERIEKYLEPPLDEQIEERAERMRDRAEDWLGRLDEVQRERIAEWSRQLGDSNAAWVANRARWDAALLQVLDERGTPGFAPALAQLFQERRETWTEDFRQRFERNEQLTLRMMVDLYAMASEEQRKHLVRQVRELRDDLAALTCTARPV